ncbi:hypothetical protein C3F09_10980 [candidate division GN15 bacterium]|uniref:Uncharacterized protein n=1 Tax=candidate division GN15 bacterium TaxID=2072418 RepID=A0A855X3Y8_9BACT|nr:MAG: hypothetical protein C3F09_10980 [candidate division GN15 bacterium]
MTRQWTTIFTIPATILCLAISGQSADPLTYTISDLRALYLFDDPETIDWATLYYLNDRYGTRIDLVTVNRGDQFGMRTSMVPDCQIFLHSATLPDTAGMLDSLMSSLFTDRYPDIILRGEPQNNRTYDSLISRLTGKPQDSGRVFHTMKVYRRSDTETNRTERSAVVLNGRERFSRYRDRIEKEVPLLFPWFQMELAAPELVSRYRLKYSALESKGAEPDFVDGIDPYRLPHLMATLVPEGAIRESFVKKARNVESFVNLALNSTGQKRAMYALAANNELAALNSQCHADSRLAAIPEIMAYLTDITDRLQKTARREIGLRWEGKIVVRDSPEGPKLKFIASLSADGPTEIDLNGVYFEPYWDTLHVLLDSTMKKIQPHQSYVREYLIDVEPARLEAQRPESLRFSASIAYGQSPFQVVSSLPIWETPNLSVKFQPSFFFVPPLPPLTVDKVVSSMTWKAIITKPPYFYGKVRLQLETPRGLYAGAYQTERSLEKGGSIDAVRIPFTVSNLFELGVQQQTLSLFVGDRLVAADTGLIRIASCKIDDTVHIGFLPDSTGMLEDVLRMAGAGFQPLTDRSLLTADFDMYNVIVIGSGAFRDYPSLRLAKGRLEDYVRHGGSIVVFGQPTEWPRDILPIELTPAPERLSAADITNRLPSAAVLSKPYDISDRILLEGLTQKRVLSAAIVAPAEVVYVTPAGGSLLSVSRIGTGQIIYCGLPLLEWTGKLNIEAIHLFANLMNY